MGKLITKEVKEKLIPMLESDDEVNWFIAFNLLKSIDGLSRNSAEEWLYLYYKKSSYKFSKRIRIIDFCKEVMSTRRRQNIYNPIIKLTSVNVNTKYGKAYQWKIK